MVLASSLVLSMHFSQLLAQTSEPLPRRGVIGASFGPIQPQIATELKLKFDEGATVMSAVPGLTADKAGLKSGDILLRMNGKTVSQTTVGVIAKELPSLKEITFSIIRDGKAMDLKTTLQEKPRDPGGADYTVEYSHVVSGGKRYRTIITRPKKPGKYPGFFFIQGLSPVSYDFPLETSKGDVASIDGPLLRDFARKPFITIRVEKPGVGDSEGGPYQDVDLDTETDIYRQTLKQLKEMPSVVSDRIYIFGPSMGAAFGPIIASENPVKGIAVYGAASRGTMEYFGDIFRYQTLLAGAPYEAVDAEVRQGLSVMSMIVMLGMSIDEAKKAKPELAPVIDAYWPGGYFNGKNPDFWRQLSQKNMLGIWQKANCRALAVKGAADFVVVEECHKLIADAVNAKNPGFGKFVVLPNSDHLFHNFATEKESQLNFAKGTWSDSFTKLLSDWIDGIEAGK